MDHRADATSHFIAQVGGYVQTLRQAHTSKESLKPLPSRNISMQENGLFSFYPLDFTFVCPTEIKKFSEKAKILKMKERKFLEFQSIPNTAIKHGQRRLGRFRISTVSDLKKEITESWNPPP